MLVELTVVQQRYRIVQEVVEQGLTVVDVAARHGVARSTLHNWLRRYRLEGLAGLTDRSHRPSSCPHQMAGWLERVLCDLRRGHPRWGPRRLQYELRREGAEPLPSRSSIYRALVRNRLVEPVPRKRRQEYRRWQRDRPMELWQLDLVSFKLANGRTAWMLTAVDDHSRFCVSARILARPDASSVCRAFREAVKKYGLPDEVLTDNGKVFTGRFGPHPNLVLFERICLQLGIRQLLTAPRKPTTTGKVERFHRTLRDDLLRDRTFVSVEEAQAAVDVFVEEYNTLRPHQSLDMATPAERFKSDELQRVEPQLTDAEIAQLAAIQPETISGDELVILSSPSPRRRRRATETPAAMVTVCERDAGGTRRKVSEVGVVSFAAANYNLGRRLAGQTVTVEVDSELVRFFFNGELVKVYRRPASGAPRYQRRAVALAGTREVIYRNRTHTAAGS